MTREQRKKRKRRSSSFQHSLTRKTFYIQHLLQFIDITEPNCKDSPTNIEPCIEVKHSPNPHKKRIKLNAFHTSDFLTSDSTPLLFLPVETKQDEDVEAQT